MVEENKSIYDEAEIIEELPEDSEEVLDKEEDTKLGEWKPTISNESPKARLERTGIKAEASGRTLTVKSYSFTRPRTQDFDGTHIPPKKSIDGKYQYYQGKLCIRFAEDNLVEYYPNIKYFVNEKGQVSNFAKFNRDGENEVTKLFKMIVEKIRKPENEISDQEALDFLVGKKVITKTNKGVFKGKAWFRNDIVNILV